MKRYAYFDTSVWLKLYIREDGSDSVQKLARAYSIVSSSILLAESFSALKRRHANKQISKTTFLKLVKQIRSDSANIDILSLHEMHIRRAETIVLETYSATLDALHIATALIFSELSGQKIPLFTADRRQAESAETLGLEVVRVGENRIVQ